MVMNIVESIRAAGVVGAGGAGFPAHVKLNGKAEYVIANGAECEPLLRVDQLLMQREAKRVVRGVALAMEATGAARGVIATKAHYHDAVHALEQALGGRNDITLHLMDSYYPSGDEKSIIFEISGRVVPSGKLPLDVGCVVSNVATLVNISAAVEGTPVIRKDVTVGGEVPHPITVTVPIGSPIREVIALSGFSGSRENFALIVGGPCMGRLEEDWDAPITKITGGLLLLRRTHPLIVRRTQSPERMLKVARAACCQCSQCTQMCPRNALGLNVQPHKAMRALITGNGALLGDPKTILACSSCGVCTNYACHMGLVPSEVMALYKSELSKNGLRPEPEMDITPDPFITYKRVPVSRLVARMGLSAYDVPAPYTETGYQPDSVTLLLRQHVGKPAVPVVRTGDRVHAGDVVAEIPEKSLGARIHAPIDGVVTRVDAKAIQVAGGESA